MKRIEAIETVRKRKASPDKAKILAFINSKPDEVFTRKEISDALGIKIETVRRYTHQLRVAKLIKNKPVKGARIRFYGTAKAIDAFEQDLSEQGLDHL